jgi:hypothetical protein
MIVIITFARQEIPLIITPILRLFKIISIYCLSPWVCPYAFYPAHAPYAPHAQAPYAPHAHASRAAYALYQKQDHQVKEDQELAVGCDSFSLFYVYV